MSTIVEIEAAIRRLPDAQVQQLGRWFDAFRRQPVPPTPVAEWLKRARGAASADVTTADVLSLTRD